VVFVAERAADCSENYTEYTTKLWQNVEYITITARGTYIYHRASGF
jgi:hypothetical protein